ncbi:hypothetical protein FGO68_gene12242 [Halteria grandinella]|uniref:Uncharacterized protein n=1 Tax=Halteria grandinella TaxID=5974 RepID=A0A8J8NTA9_HALGN|nr:hypothetical protein FGO68_gene12242 [Halteria grandinella]
MTQAFTTGSLLGYFGSTEDLFGKELFKKLVSLMIDAKHFEQKLIASVTEKARRHHINLSATGSLQQVWQELDTLLDDEKTALTLKRAEVETFHATPQGKNSFDQQEVTPSPQLPTPTHAATIKIEETKTPYHQTPPTSSKNRRIRKEEAKLIVKFESQCGLGGDASPLDTPTKRGNRDKPVEPGHRRKQMDFSPGDQLSPPLDASTPNKRFKLATDTKFPSFTGPSLSRTLSTNAIALLRQNHPATTTATDNSLTSFNHRTKNENASITRVQAPISPFGKDEEGHEFKSDEKGKALYRSKSVGKPSSLYLMLKAADSTILRDERRLEILEEFNEGTNTVYTPDQLDIEYCKNTKDDHFKKLTRDDKKHFKRQLKWMPDGKSGKDIPTWASDPQKIAFVHETINSLYADKTFKMPAPTKAELNKKAAVAIKSLKAAMKRLQATTSPTATTASPYKPHPKK